MNFPITSLYAIQHVIPLAEGQHAGPPWLHAAGALRVALALAAPLRT